ncbi:MAG TPA: RluA family pseudouridine synthase [Alphaproteobacteria bacterium]|nr:RluA family pseudouridine synthase [Alphaproteobacteria bacterium]
MAGVSIVKVKTDDDGIRLNRWFLREYPSLSLSRLQKLLRTKQIKVDGKRAETSTRLIAGQEIRIPPLDNEKAPLKNDFVSKTDEKFIKDMVVFKDENIIVLNKPSGIAVQGGTNQEKHIDGLLDALKFDKEERPKLTHRIDKETSGLLVLARNRKYALILTKAFREHNLKKTYLALCEGCPKKQAGEIKANLEKVGEKMIAGEDGQRAVTEYEVLDSVGSKFSLIKAMPLTGRTHQIRVHLALLGASIVGDRKYGNRNLGTDLASKLHLHAWQIDLSEVMSKKCVVKAPIPDYFKKDIEFLGFNFKEK